MLTAFRIAKGAHRLDNSLLTRQASRKCNALASIDWVFETRSLLSEQCGELEILSWGL